MPFRISTFNAENLFSRAKIVNLKSNAASTTLLDQVGALEVLLASDPYSPADKTRIKQLFAGLKNYIDIRVDKGKLFDSKNNVKAKGASAWEGEMTFKIDQFTALQRKATSQVLSNVKADVQCMVEIENLDVLRRFNSDFTLGFAYPILIDALDPRGIDVGLYSRSSPIKSLHTHMYDKSGTSRIFSRDCLEVELELADGGSLFVLCNHLKSQGYGTQAANNAKRLLQAETIRQILGGYDLEKQKVVVLGDFNDSPQNAPLQPLLTMPGLHDVFDIGNVAAADRWTYYYQKVEQIDYILVSDPLKQKFVGVGLERRGLYNVATLTGNTIKPFPGITTWSNAASDHAAVWADFILP